MAITKLTELQCGTCGVWHAIPEKMYDTKKAEGGFWHCPNGHSWGWGKGTLRAENERLKQKEAQLLDEIQMAQTVAHQARQEREKAEKKLVASRRRAVAGTCPCCKRTFTNMARHMKTKHPDFDPNVIDLGIEKAKRA